jgi:hypothetical protein
MTRGLFDRFMMTFTEKVDGAVRRIDAMNLGVRDLSARIEGRFIRLSGVAPSREVALRVIELFKQFAEVENIRDAIRIGGSPPSGVKA